jgi:hypothetical protein
MQLGGARLRFFKEKRVQSHHLTNWSDAGTWLVDWLIPFTWIQTYDQ